jgi:hypothetical protein
MFGHAVSMIGPHSLDPHGPCRQRLKHELMGYGSSS